MPSVANRTEYVEHRLRSAGAGKPLLGADVIALEKGDASGSMLEAVTATAGDLKESIAEYWQTIDPFVPDEPPGPTSRLAEQAEAV